MSDQEILVTQIMQTPVPIVGPDDTVATVARMIVDWQIPGVLVVEGGNLLGIVTEADFVKREAQIDFPAMVPFFSGTFDLGRLPNPWDDEEHDDASEMDEEFRKITAITARDLMTSPVLNVRNDATLSELATLMIDHNINPVPVVNDQLEIVGIVTRTDLVGLIARLESDGVTDDSST